MAFTYVGTIGGSYSPVVVTMPVSSLTLPQGALVSKAPASNTLAVFDHTTVTTVPLLGVTNGAIASTDLFADVTITPTGTRGFIDILQIVNKTAIVVTSGSGTTAVFTTASNILKGIYANKVFVGAKFKVITCASGDAKPGDILTVTDYVASTATITFASVGSTGFASGDTVQLLSLAPSSLEQSNPTSLSTATIYNYVGGAFRLFLDTTSNTGYASIDLLQDMSSPVSNYRWAYVLGTSGNGTKLDIVLMTGPNQTSAST